MIEARETGADLQVSWMHRYFEEVEAARTLLANHRLGQVTSVRLRNATPGPDWGDWFFRKDIVGGGVVLPPGPLIQQRAPEFSRWTIFSKATAKSGDEQSKSPVDKPKNPNGEPKFCVTKTGDITRVIYFDDAKQPQIGSAVYPYTGPSGYECMPSYYSDAQGPFGRNISAATRIRSKIRQAGFLTPVVVSGGIHHFSQAEHALRSGAADIVGFARQALADPDWFLKVREGRGADVRLCLYTNYCEALDQRHREVTCELWDRINLDEPGIMMSADGKRRLLPP